MVKSGKGPRKSLKKRHTRSRSGNSEKYSKLPKRKKTRNT